MKKIIPLILVISFILGCSNNDSNNSNDYFLNININGTNYDSDFFYTDYPGEENCLNNGDLVLNQIGDLENSQFSITCYLAYFENLNDFSNPTKNVISNTRFTDTNDLWEWIHNEDACSRNNDFSIVYEDKSTNTFLRLKPNTSPNHTITDVEFNYENSTSKYYDVEGTFNAILVKGNLEVPITGNYRTQLLVLK